MTAQPDPGSVPRKSQIPRDTPVLTVSSANNQQVLIPVDTVSLKLLQLLKENECPEGRLRDTSVCHQSEASVKRSERNAGFLENIAEGPVGIGFIIISQPCKLSGNISRILIRIMQRAVRYVRGIELRHMNRQSAVLRITVNDFPCGVQIRESVLRLHQLRISVMPGHLRHLCCIMMTADKVRPDSVLLTELHELANPELVGSSADGGPSHLESGIHLLHCGKGFGKQPEILLHIRVLPEPFQIRFIPHLDWPGKRLPAVSLQQMAQKRLNQLLPLFIRSRRSRVAFPVEDGLGSPRQLLRHESQLKKRLQPELMISIHYPVQISEVVFGPPLPVLLILLVNRHIVAEQAMPSDMPESYHILNEPELFLILSCQSQPHPSCSHAIINLIMKRYPGIRMNPDCPCIHILFPPVIADNPGSFFYSEIFK